MTLWQEDFHQGSRSEQCFSLSRCRNVDENWFHLIRLSCWSRELVTSHHNLNVDLISAPAQVLDHFFSLCRTSSSAFRAVDEIKIYVTFSRRRHLTGTAWTWDIHRRVPQDNFDWLPTPRVGSRAAFWVAAQTSRWYQCLLVCPQFNVSWLACSTNSCGLW